MKLKKQMRLMVAYLLQTEDKEVIESYTKTFCNIAIEYYQDKVKKQNNKT